MYIIYISYIRYIYFFPLKRYFFPFLFWLGFSASDSWGRTFSLFLPWSTHKPLTALLCSATGLAVLEDLYKCKWLSKAASSGTWIMWNLLQRCCPPPEENRIVLIACIQPHLVLCLSQILGLCRSSDVFLVVGNGTCRDPWPLHSWRYTTDTSHRTFFSFSAPSSLPQTPDGFLLSTLSKRVCDFFAVFLKTQPGCWLTQPRPQIGMRVFRCCLLYKLAWCRVVNLGKHSGKANSLSENRDSWLHEPSVWENVGMWVLSACECSARRFGVSVPAITAAICLCFTKQEEGEDLIRSRTQVE